MHRDYAVKAYLAGAFRDGYIGVYVEKNGKKHYVARIYNSDLTWLRTLARIVLRVYNIKMNLIIPGKGTPYIEKYDRDFVLRIAKEYNHPLGKQYNWDTPLFIKYSHDRELWRAYIAGFFDAEGGVDKTKKQLKIYQSWNGKECPPLQDIKDSLEKLFNIETGRVSRYVNKNGKYPRFILRIKKKHTIRFIQQIPLTNLSKIKKIKQILT